MGLRGPAKTRIEAPVRKRGKAAVAESSEAISVVYTGPELRSTDKPKYVKKRAAEIWDLQLKLAPQLRACDVLLFADYCVCAAEMERCHAIVTTKGFLQRRSNNTQSKREEVGLLDDLRGQVLKLASALGFSPYARKQQGIEIKMPKVEDASTPGAAALNKRRQASEIMVARIPARPRS